MIVSSKLSARIANASLVASLAVVFLHFAVESGQAGLDMPVRMLLRDLSRFAVPYFFLVSGFFLAGHAGEDGWWRRETLKRMRTVLVPYLVWSLAFGGFMLAAVAGPELCRVHAFDWSAWWQAKRFLLVGLDLREPPLLLPLWYLRTLLLLVVISPLLFGLVRKAPRMTLGALGLVYLSYSLSVDVFPQIAAYDAIALVRQTLSPEAFFFFSAGAWLRGRDAEPSAGRVWPWLAAAVVLLLLKQNGVLVPYALIVPLTMAGVWLAVPGRAWPRALTSLAFPIYLIHYFFVILAVRGGGGSIAASGLAFSLACCAIVAASVGISLLLRRLPSSVVSILFGGR